MVTKGQRVALNARDIGCAFPGCDRPAHWCDAHHVVPWKDGGPTTLDNLVLLCRYHHSLTHGGWTIEGEPGDLLFYRPDGTLLEESRPVEPVPHANAGGSARFSNPRVRLAAFQAIKDKYRHLGRDDPD